MTIQSFFFYDVKRKFWWSSSTPEDNRAQGKLDITVEFGHQLPYFASSTFLRTYKLTCLVQKWQKPCIYKEKLTGSLWKVHILWAALTLWGSTKALYKLPQGLIPQLLCPDTACTTSCRTQRWCPCHSFEVLLCNFGKTAFWNSEAGGPRFWKQWRREGKLFVNQETDEKQGRKLLPTSSKSYMCIRSNKKVNAVWCLCSAVLTSAFIPSLSDSYAPALTLSPFSQLVLMAHTSKSWCLSIPNRNAAADSLDWASRTSIFLLS